MAQPFQRLNFPRSPLNKFRRTYLANSIYTIIIWTYNFDIRLSGNPQITQALLLKNIYDLLQNLLAKYNCTVGNRTAPKLLCYSCKWHLAWHRETGRGITNSELFYSRWRAVICHPFTILCTLCLFRATRAMPSIYQHELWISINQLAYF